MYNPYINYTKRYFLNNIAIIESFHVVSWLLYLIIIYINDVKKKYKERDKKDYIDKLKKQNKPINETTLSEMPISKEVYLLNNYRWLLTSNNERIDYQLETRFNRKLYMYLNTYDYEKLFFELDDHFKASRIRLIWANRKNQPILATPKSKKEVYTYKKK